MRFEPKRLGDFMSRQFRFAIMAGLLVACSGCLHEAITRPEDLAVHYDQVEHFTAQRPFEEVHAFVSGTASKCYAKAFSSTLMPAGKGYVSAGEGIHRDVEDRVLEPGKRAFVAVVVRGGPWPLGPEDYMLRVDIQSVGDGAVEITSYNAQPVRAQRAFHRQVHRWVVDAVEDCSGSGPFG